METLRRRIGDGAISFHPALSHKSDDRASGQTHRGATEEGRGTRAAVEVDARSGRDREWSGAADLVSHIPPLHIHPPESRLQYLNQGEQADARDGHLNLNGRTRTDARTDTVGYFYAGYLAAYETAPLPREFIFFVNVGSLRVLDISLLDVPRLECTKGRPTFPFSLNLTSWCRHEGRGR